ncbi:unnamed protein product [Clonostachys rhizophaga]|uniref:Uncharacterized protein n=1 Tax=Clonostachys rhizophaga TaxID=160324 RepID=A0A9N9VUE3_9HYPO|nr:unnamed protein product [Clonostachys rhizophaga]
MAIVRETHVPQKTRFRKLYYYRNVPLQEPTTSTGEEEVIVQSNGPTSPSSSIGDSFWVDLWNARSPSEIDTSSSGGPGNMERLLGRSIVETSLIESPTATDSDDTRIATPDRRSSELSLSCVPTLQMTTACPQLPPDLLNSTVRRLLWDYFVNRASQVFLCWEPDDAHLDKKYTDPFTDHLPAVAAGSRPMMLASLALSAFHFAGGRHNSEDDSLITSLMSEASNALAASRWQGPQTFGQLLATVGTASFLYLLKPSSYSDMLPLGRSAACCLTVNPRWRQNVNEPCYQVIMQIFRWSDICAQCSLKRYVSVPDENTQLNLELREGERATNISASYAEWFVHPLYAFAEDLIAPLRRVAWLARLRQQGHVVPTGMTDEAGALCMSSDNQTIEATDSTAAFTISTDRFKALVEESQEMIQAASGRVGPAGAQLDAPDLRTNLNRLAIAVESAVVILFYTRLRDTPWTSSLIRFHVRKVVDSLCNIAAGSRFANGVVFPLYIAGLEAVDTDIRSMIINQIKHLPGIWSQQESQLVTSLQHVWELRDADPGAVWRSWIHKGNAPDERPQGSTDCETLKYWTDH